MAAIGKGTLRKGTLYRFEAGGGLTAKIPLDEDVEVEYVGRSGDLRAYVLPDGLTVYVEVGDDLAHVD